MKSVLPRISLFCFRPFHILNLTLACSFLILLQLNAFSQTWQVKGADIEAQYLYGSFGQDISMNDAGSVIAIGATSDDNVAEDAGLVQVFEYDGFSWIQRGGDIFGEDAEDELSQGLCLNAEGTILAVGAPEDYSSLTDPGYVKVFSWDGTEWIQMGQRINGDQPDDRFGYTVSLDSSGYTMAVGARSSLNGEESGHVQVYQWDDSVWIEKGDKLIGELAQHNFCWTMDLSSDGNTIAIGGPYGGTNHPGHAKVFNWNGSEWVQKGETLYGEELGEIFGFALSMSSEGNIVAVSARGDRTYGAYTGKVRVYAWNDTSWVQRGTAIIGDSALNSYGWSVSLDADGSTLAIGAHGNFISDTSSGYVDIFDWNGLDWQRAGARLYGTGHRDRFGTSVALSADGDIVAAGGNLDASGTTFLGHVQVLTRNGVSQTENAEIKEEIKVFPNPSAKAVMIDLGRHVDHIELTLVNSSGLIMDKRTYRNVEVVEYDLDVQTGLYILQIVAGEKIHSQRVIKY